MSSAPTPDDYLSSFPYPSLQKVEGQPTYESLNHLRQELKANAASVPTNNGGGSNGYLGLVVSAAIYATIAPGTPFVIPPFPGATPAIPEGSTAAVTGELVRQHTARLRQFHEFTSVHAALKKQLIVREDCQAAVNFH